MPSISKSLKRAGSFGLVLLAGSAGATRGRSRNDCPIGITITGTLAVSHVRGSNSEIPQASGAAKALTQEQYQRELAKLDALDRAKDLDGLLKVGEDVENKWGRAGGQFYGQLMLEIGNLVENHFDGAGVFAASQKYISNALAKSDSFPLRLEIRLLRFLLRDVASADSNDRTAWIRERHAKVGLWLHAWRRLEIQINRNFDFSDRPKLNVAPPDETGLPAGIVPEGIKDPKLRARYESALAANAKKGREYNRQFDLRTLDETFPKIAEGYVVRVYSQRPYHIEELRRQLIAYRLNRQIRERVLSQVKRKVAQSQ